MPARSLPDHEAHRDNQSASRGYGDLCAGICNGGDRADAKPIGGKDRPTGRVLAAGLVHKSSRPEVIRCQSPSQFLKQPGVMQ